jgi:hypothetical protein
MLYGTFGILIIILLFVGFYRRKMENRTWQREERYEESGDWIDKRSGERGSYGRRDRERESERRAVFQQGKVVKLAEETAQFLQVEPAKNIAFLRRQMSLISLLAEAMIQDEILPNTTTAPTPEVSDLKAFLLEKVYDIYPELLDLPIEKIQDFDRRLGAIAMTIRQGVVF